MDLIQVIGSLVHTFPLGRGAGGIHFQDRASRDVMLAIDRARFAAVQVASVANKRD
jgi:hypothetical protein